MEDEAGAGQISVCAVSFHFLFSLMGEGLVTLTITVCFPRPDLLLLDGESDLLAPPCWRRGGRCLMVLCAF